MVVVGGAGRVGSMTLPYLADRHPLRVYDLRPPRPDVPGVAYVAGDVTDFDSLSGALAGADALVYMAMGPPEPAAGDPPAVATHVDVSVKGLTLALLAAAQHGIRHAVYTSTMSVYREPRQDYPDETVAPDAVDYYGLLKRLGEEVCRSAVDLYGLSVVALRLCRPVPDDAWPPADDPTGEIATSAGDTARALLAALGYRGYGFTAIAVNGDREQRRISIDKAKRLLGWEPRDAAAAPPG